MEEAIKLNEENPLLAITGNVDFKLSSQGEGFYLSILFFGKLLAGNFKIQTMMCTRKGGGGGDGKIEIRKQL